MRIRLVGGECDGDWAGVERDRARPGEWVAACKPMQPISAFDPNDPNCPEIVESTVLHYRIHAICTGKDREMFLYAVPQHWTEREGLIALFGRPMWR